MTNELWGYLRRQAEKSNCRFLRCNGVLYEVTKTHYTTGPSPLWSVDEIRPKDVPGPEPEEPLEYGDDCHDCGEDTCVCAD